MKSRELFKCVTNNLTRPSASSAWAVVVTLEGGRAEEEDDYVMWVKYV